MTSSNMSLKIKRGREDILYINNKIIVCGVNYNWNEIRIIEFY